MTSEEVNGLFKRNIKWWLFECAKQEHRVLIDLGSDVLVFTPEEENISPFRFNFLDVPEKIGGNNNLEGV